MKPNVMVIPAYALFANIGLFCMMITIYFRSRKMVIPFERLLILYLLLVAGAGIGSKFLFILTQVPKVICNFSNKHLLYVIITSGFVFYGGLFGAIIGAYVFSRYYLLDFKKLTDVITPGFAIFHIWGRIGCFFAGCCYGKEADWGVALYNEPEVLRIPIQLIESFCIFTVLLIVIWAEKKYEKNVHLLEVYIFLYAACKFVLEFFRGDAIRGKWLFLSTSQWISMFIVIVIPVLKIGSSGFKRIYQNNHVQFLKHEEK